MQSLSEIGGSFLQKALDLVLPPRCIVTGQIVEIQGMTAPEAWRRLDFIADPLCACCGVPFAFEIEKDMLCAACLAERPHFGRARAALKYDEVSRELILGFKHGDQTHYVRSFIPWMLKAGAELWPDADLIAPVPLHPVRLLRRRYNQAAMLARALGKAAQLPVETQILRRVRRTAPQGRFSPAQRRKNVARAFHVPLKARSAIAGKRILLIDDVLTTGATADECARALLQAGAAHVDVLAVARRVREGFEG